MPAFISHHLFKGDIDLIIKIERTIHFFYVHLPAIGILFVHSIVDKKNRIIEAGAFVISFILSIFTFTEYYISGMIEYSWGYIAKAGIAMDLFGLFSLGFIIYSLILIINKMKTGLNEYTRLKIRYIMIALLIMSVLTLGNLFPMNGIDVYPPGNFAFIAMLFMAWGIFRYDAIKINLYTKRLIAEYLLKAFILAGLGAASLVVFRAVGTYSISYILDKTVLYGIPPLISVIICIYLSFLAVRLGDAQKESIIFSLMMFAYAMLCLDIYINITTPVSEVGLQVSRFAHLFIVFLPALGMHLIRNVSGRTSESRVLKMTYAAGFLLLLFVPTDYYLSGMYHYSWGMFAKKGPAFNIMAFIAVSTLIYIIFVVYTAWRKSTIRFYRHRFLFLLIGFSGAAILSLGNMPAIHGYDIYPPGSFIFIPAIFIAIALFRHNIPEMVRLAGAFVHYGVMGGSVFTAVYLLNESRYDSFLPLYTSLSMGGILALNFYMRRLRDYISGRQTEKMAAAFENLNDRLSSARSMEEITDCVNSFLSFDFNCDQCSLVILDQNSQVYSGRCCVKSHNGIKSQETPSSITVNTDNPLLEYIFQKHSPAGQEEIEYWILNDDLTLDSNDPLRMAKIIVPVFFETRMTALVLIGSKSDGSLYSSDETGFLYQMGINLGPHIENAGILQWLEEIIEKRTRELFKSERKYRHFIENTDEIIYKTDREGNFIYINPAFNKKTGYTAEEILKMNYIELIPPEHRDRETAFYRGQLKNKIEESFRELSIVTKSGNTLRIEQDVKAVKDDTGHIFEFDCIVHDITERKRDEDARRNLEEAKTRFFANISHEIRTPLTLMLGPIEAVLQGEYNKETDTAFFQNLHRNTLRLLKLVNNLLDFSKIEAGRMTLRVQEGDMVHFARLYLTGIELACQSRNIKLNFESSSDSISVLFDPQKMDKVLMNLLSNALKFTPDGGEINISVSEDDTRGYIRITDTGEGIPEESIEAIFDRFGQADITSTRKYEGTGIGLALVKELVHLHGGKINVESRYIEDYPYNHGSVFTVSLLKGTEHFSRRNDVEFIENNSLDDYVKDYRSIRMGEIEGQKINSEIPEESDQNEEQLRNSEEKTILVVDDNEDMRNFLKMLLGKHYQILMAENGEEGIGQARDGRPDLIITDVMMPVMNGFEMTSFIKNDHQLKTIPVIMLTADTELMNKVSGLEKGADDYLHKPFNSMELTTRISSLIKNYEYQQIISRRNAEIEKELEVARLLQQKLLPSSIPEVSGYSAHAVYIPVDKVGGDFYDIYHSEGVINLFIADVSGHGLPGAFLATVTRIALDNISSPGKKPQEILTLLNNVIMDYTVQSNFVTAFSARIDTSSNVMTYSCAGHEPPLLYRKKDQIFQELQTKGMPLGWFDKLKIDENKVQLESGDRVVFYTDGITECRSSSGELFGDERFKQLIENSSDKTPELFSETLIKELELFSDNDNFDDDITMLVFDVV